MFELSVVTAELRILW